MTDPSNQDKTPYLSWQELKEAADQILMEQVVAGNDDAFAFIVERYQRLVYSVAFRFVEDRGEAQDVVQVAFLDAYRAKGLFDPSKGTLKMWLLQYAYTRAINRRYHLKQRHFYSKLNVDEIKPLQYSTARAADRWLMAPEANRYVTQALELLSSGQRAAIHLIAIEGMTIQEASDKLGHTLPKTRHDYYRGMLKLQKILVSQEEELQNRKRAGEEHSASKPAGEVSDYIKARAARAV